MRKLIILFLTLAIWGTSFVTTSLATPPANTGPMAQRVKEDTALPIRTLTVSDVDGDLTTVELSVLQGTLKLTLKNAAAVAGKGTDTDPLILSGPQADIIATLPSLIYQGNLNFDGKDRLSMKSTDAAGDSDTRIVDITVQDVSPSSNVCDWSKSGKQRFAGDLSKNWSAGSVVSYSVVRYNLADKKSSFNARAAGFGLAFRYYTDESLKFFGGNGFIGKPSATKSDITTVRAKRISPLAIQGAWENLAGPIVSDLPADTADNTSIQEIPAGCRADTTDFLENGEKIAHKYSISPTFYVFQDKNDNDLGTQLALNFGFFNDILTIGVGWNLSGPDAGEWFVLAGPSFGLNF